MSYVYALVYLAALASFVAQARKAPRPATRAAWAWAAPVPITLAVLSGWGLAGLIEGWFTIIVAPLSAALIVAAGLIALRRDEVRTWLGAQDILTRRRIRRLYPVAVLGLCMLTIEVPFNSWLPFRGPTYFWLEMLLCGLLMATLYFLGQRHAGLGCAGVAFFFVAGMGQHFVRRFKNAAILPTDLLVLDTAAAVTKEYVFSLNEQSLMGVACALLTIAALALVEPGHLSPIPLTDEPDDLDLEERNPPAPKPTAAMPQSVTINVAAAATASTVTSSVIASVPSATRPPVLRNLGLALASAALLAFLVLVPSYQGLLGVQMQYWYSIDYYQKQGFLPSFIAVMQDMPIKRPKGYSTEEAAELTQAYAARYREAAAADAAHEQAAAQFAEQRPSVIVVMNESFADLSLFDGMHAGYEGPQFYKTGLTDTLARGTLNVSVHGAGTCNTEFEFLTGNSLGFIGAGKYPYSIYDLSNVDALAAQFKSLGYHTCAIHPNYPTNWNRHKVYPQMGFDEFLAIDDFGGKPDVAVDRTTPNEPHCEVFHSGVSDIETYRRMLAMLKESDEPRFFFDVTMANHGSYNQYNIPAAYQQHYVPADYVGDETPDRLNEYLACIAKSDDDLREFVGELRALERPVVLVFFGDHQPSLSASYNDYWYQNEPEDVHARRAYSSTYVVWANYDVAGREQTGKEDETSVDMLAAQTLDLIGAPVSDFQAAQLSIRSQIPSLSAADYQGQDRKWYVPDANGPYGAAYHDLSLIEYLNFAERI